jgi:hypothetical protein
MIAHPNSVRCDQDHSRALLIASAIASPHRVARHHERHHPAGMFVVTEAETATIRAAFEQQGEFAAAVELRRLCPGVTDNGQARECARTIAGWKPLPVPLRRVTRPSPDKRR